MTYMRVMRGEGFAGGSAETSLATATFFITAWKRGALVRKTASDAQQSLKVV